MSDCRAPIVLTFFAIATLAGCARHPTVAPLAEAAPAEVAPPRPALTQGYGSVVPPPRDSAGHYLTINSGLSPQAATWHLRAALNVAAIGCRGPADAGIAPAYNIMLSSKKTVLANANRAIETGFRARSGSGWQADNDAFMTRLYNYFAMPAAKPAFCAAADTIAPQAASIPATDFERYAASALPQLESAFTDVFAVVDQYKVALAAWDARYGPGAEPTRLAAAPSAPLAPLAALASPPYRATHPRLAYADLSPVLAWEPKAGEALALR